MYTFKSIARRGTLLVAAAALAVSALLPSQAVFADALNPLTERSLSLSSGSPGWSYLDASGNGTYAPPNSGANGRKTGNTFSFRVSSTASVKAFSFQYCTTSAGNCMGPGNIPFTGSAGSYAREPNDDDQVDAQKSDLEVKTATPTEVSTFGTKFNTTTGVPTNAANIPNRNNSEGNFIVMHKANSGDPWVQSTGWTMTASVNQVSGGSAGVLADGTSTGKNNYITLTNAAGLSLNSTDYVKIIFFATDTNYMINPGAGAFFAKLNTYNSDSSLIDTNVIDGGVTVANVMNRSIEIQTKVLETMDFSVGVVDPNTLDSTDTDGVTPGVQSQLKTANGNNAHGTCDAILPGMTQNPATPNVLQMGDADGEFSLATAVTYSTHSYWRLSSNSSAGATVYYSGVTLSNTVGDQINEIGKVADTPRVGMEQFGLALDNGVNGTQYEVSYEQERDTNLLYENGVDNGIEDIHTSSLTANGVFANASWHTPKLYPLAPLPNYGGGTGVINDDYGSIDTEFAFDADSTVIPTPIASENDQVVDCVTGKVRYIANIAATTPAGIYTTKVNWIAAPQY
ncbi:MAG TPA: hypothetical protein VF281_03640 [Candidatus Saccharimonadales bacterium]